jgi:hypothetical protein
VSGERLIPMARAVADAGGATVGMMIGVPAAITVGAALTGFRWAVNPVNVALIFMVLVVAVAALGGRTAGAITAAASVVSYDFFHTQPYLTMAIESRNDIETTTLLLLAGLMAGALTTSRRTARRHEHAARDEVRRLHRITEAAASRWPPAVLLEIAQDEIKDLLDLEQCRFEALPYSDPGSRPKLGRNGGAAGQTLFRFRRDRDGRPGFELPAAGLDLDVILEGRQIGRFILIPKPGTGTSLHSRLAAVVIADLIAAVWTPLTARPEKRSEE